MDAAGADDGILWPSQMPNNDAVVTASVEQAKAKADTEALKAEKEAALAAKRKRFDQMFPVSSTVQSKLD